MYKILFIASIRYLFSTHFLPVRSKSRPCANGLWKPFLRRTGFNLGDAPISQSIKLIDFILSALACSAACYFSFIAFILLRFLTSIAQSTGLDSYYEN